MRALLISLVVSFAAAGCAEELARDMPTSPDMEPVILAFEVPTAELNKANLQTVFESLDEQFQLTERFCGRLEGESGAGGSCVGLEILLASVGAVGKAQQRGEPGETGGTTGQLSAALSFNGTEVSGEGFFDVRRTCPGWGPNAPIDVNTNGGVTLTMTMSEAGFDPVVWGNLNDCRLESEGHKLKVSGDFHMYLGVDQGPVVLNPDYVVLEISARVAIDEQVFEGKVDLRIRMTGKVEVRVPVVDQHLIFFHETKGNTSSTGFRATNGTWGCFLEQKQCTNEAGDTIVW